MNHLGRRYWSSLRPSLTRRRRYHASTAYGAQSNEQLCIPFYYDYKSPFSYLISDKVQRLDKDYNVRVEYLPFNIDLEAAGLGVEQNPLKTKYLYVDARRWATQDGKKVFGPGKIYNTRPACLGALYLLAHNPDKFFPYHNKVFYDFWEVKEPNKLAVHEPNVIFEVLKHFDETISDQAWTNFVTGEGLNALQHIENRAKSDGVFGVPSLLVDGELFFGNDRMDWVVRKLDSMGLHK